MGARQPVAQKACCSREDGSRYTARVNNAGDRTGRGMPIAGEAVQDPHWESYHRKRGVSIELARSVTGPADLCHPPLPMPPRFPPILGPFLRFAPALWYDAATLNPGYPRV